jgi:hypothetical protein
MPKNAAERRASSLCGRIMEHATDPAIEALAVNLDGELVAAINEERDRAYLLGLAVGLQMVNAGKDGAR